MLFGEIVEPSTRALILDDELEQLPEYKVPEFKWEGEPQPPPDGIENLIFADSKKVIQLCSKITKGRQPVAKLINEGLSIYTFEKNYLAVFDENSTNLVIGEIVELMSLWIKKAKHIHCITTALLSSFQPREILGDTPPVTFARCLTNHEEVPYNFCQRLEAPNLVQGLGASVLTYCVHSNRKASLWVVFSDGYMPLDSVNACELVRLFKVLGFQVKLDFMPDPLSSNLYL